MTRSHYVAATVGSPVVLHVLFVNYLSTWTFILPKLGG